jgi:hypothetical protein
MQKYCKHWHILCMSYMFVFGISEQALWLDGLMLLCFLERYLRYMFLFTSFLFGLWCKSVIYFTAHFVIGRFYITHLSADLSRDVGMRCHVIEALGSFEYSLVHSRSIGSIFCHLARRCVH